MQDLNFDRYTPWLAFETYFNVLHDKSVSYFIPKKANFGWYENELPFYYDFQFQDGYKYFIKTDKPVTVVNATDFTTDIKTDFGTYTITLSYPQPGIIQIESKMIVKNEHVPAKEVVNLAAVYSANEQLNKKELVLKLQ